MATQSDSHLEDQQEEIEALRSIYNDEFHLLSCTGTSCCSNKIQITPDGTGIVLTFSLSDSYPAMTPRIDIELQDGCGITAEMVGELFAKLYEMGKHYIGDAMIYNLVEFTKHWVQVKKKTTDAVALATTDVVEEQDKDVTVCQFHLQGKCRFGEKCKNPHVGEEITVCKKLKELDMNDSEKVTKKDKSIPNEEEIVAKKPPMKTASDVISRIQWDSSLSKKRFTVGYLDRFLGIIEKPFTVFTWTSELASVDDHFELAIPQHRIQYFKYRDTIVWDKNCRLDNVFGSTGSGTTILEVIDKYRQLHPDDKDDDETDSACEEPYEDYDFGVVEPVGVETPMEAAAKTDRPRHIGPNYFIAVRITNPAIGEAVKTLQDKIVESVPDLRNCCSTIDKLHITVATLRIDTGKEMQIAFEVLQKLKYDLSHLLKSPIMLHFQGLQNFHGQVLYAATNPDPIFDNFHKQLTSCFENAGLKIVGEFSEFVPHMTIAQMSRFVGGKLHAPTMISSLCDKYSEYYFGAQGVEFLHLCSIGQGLTHDGFYPTADIVDLYEDF
ncbi:leukocyte receptor cluster member 9-like [Saccoglossus kowalevskii]|uniref:Uncharacterized protein LOC100371765 n=1 Tax=Saccoglossus kowalevskii TaxID=10224 RepID=A0ABM0GMM3_SACKO|nr:PREDICTED: uncharacterized protein LOC100371765 [Saccoglossus kowalevskii]